MGSARSQQGHWAGHDQKFTDTVIMATGDEASPRMRAIMTSLIQHLHDFAREVDLTADEWLLGLEFMNRCANVYQPNRDEIGLISHALGMEALIESLNSRHNKKTSCHSNGLVRLQPTSSCILGPFYRQDAPLLPHSSSIISPQNREAYKSSTTHVKVAVVDSTTGRPIEGALLDVWHTAPNGMYDSQDSEQPDMDLRGRFQTDDAGRCDFYCLRPVAYALPDDGPTWQLLQCLDRHPWRPAHLHFVVSAPGYDTVVTQLFDSDDEHLDTDAVFATKTDLVVRYKPNPVVEEARWRLDYQFVLARASR